MRARRDLVAMNSLGAIKLYPYRDEHAVAIELVMRQLYKSPRFLQLQKRLDGQGFGDDRWNAEYWKKRDAHVYGSRPTTTSSWLMSWITWSPVKDDDDWEDDDEDQTAVAAGEAGGCIIS